jgi:serine/threonine-protein kinase
MSRTKRETSCPASSRFWEVALGESWDTGEFRHVASCERCQATETTIRTTVGKDSDPTRDDSPTTLPADSLSTFWSHSSAPSGSELPRRLGDYELIALIARGGMGAVYRARDLALGRIVAIKIVPSVYASDGHALDRFCREARVCARLHHPAIVPIYGVHQADGVPFIVSQLIEGRPLSGSDRLPPREAARVAVQVADALHYAHEQGIIHRDVKPTNIILRPDGSPVLTDFGLARMYASGEEAECTWEGEILGTPAYMSPEQVFGNLAALGPASDIYNLGATLYSLLAGRPPFRGTSAIETLQLIHEVEPVPLRRLDPNIPRDLEAICLKCLAKDPARRYASARALAEDLRRFLDGEPIDVRRGGLTGPVLAWTRRRAGWCAALLLGVLAVAALAWQRSELQALHRRLDVAVRHQDDTVARSDLRGLVNRTSERELRRAIQLAESRLPNHPEDRRSLVTYYHHLGDLLINTDRPQSAARAYERAARLLDPEDRADLGELARTLERLNQISGRGARSRRAQ